MLKEFKIYWCKIRMYIKFKQNFDNERFSEFIERKRLKREEVKFI